MENSQSKSGLFEKLHSVLEVLKERGIIKTSAFIFSYLLDLRFDKKYDVDTASWVSLKSLEINSDNFSRGEDYQPTQVKPLRKLFNATEFIFIVDFVPFPANIEFVVSQPLCKRRRQFFSLDGFQFDFTRS